MVIRACCMATLAVLLLFPPIHTAPDLGRASGQPESAAATLVGRVVAADGGAGVKYATIRLTSRAASLAASVSATSGQLLPGGARPPGDAGASCQTDENGYFELARLAPDRYVLNVESPGYARPFPLQGIDLEAGKTAVVHMALERPGAISGHVLPDAGGAPASVRVRLLRRDMSDGSGRMVIGTLGPGSIATADAQGAFAFTDLPPGDYYLVAGSFSRPGPSPAGPPATGPHVGYVPTYYPGSTLPAGAVAVTVRGGQETRDADFALRRDKLGTVSGRALDSSGKPFPMGPPPQPMRASLMLRSVIDDPALVTSVVRYPDGRYAIPNVPPGDYYLTASVSTAANGPAAAPAESAFVPVTVNGNEVHVDVRTNTGATLAGRVVIEGTRAASGAAGNAAQIIVTARPPVSSAAPATHAAVSPAADGTFQMAPLRGSFVLSASATGLTLERVQVGGRDVTGKTIDLKGTERIADAVITMTADTARLQGTVTNGEGAPVAAVVILYPDDADRFVPQSPGLHVTRSLLATTPVNMRPATTAGADRGRLPSPGGFTFPTVLPGRYLLVAVDAGNSMPVLDRESFKRWRPTATEVTLTSNQTTTAQVRVVR